LDDHHTFGQGLNATKIDTIKVDTNRYISHALRTMKLETVSESINYAKGQPLPGLTGKVVKVWTQDAKQRTDGEEYLKQGIVIADLNAPKTEVTVNFYDHAAYGNDIVGKVVIITPGPKGGLKSAGPWKEKFYVDCSKACDVTFEGASQGATPRPAPSPAPAAQRPAAPAAPARAVTRTTWREHASAQGQIIRIALAEARQIAREIEMEGGMDGGGLSSDNLVAMAMNIVISGERSGLSIDSTLGAAPEVEDNMKF
jgi:hypothetical protein